ncbi:hypothetical protein L596_013090 [Steinernema carpocapsae]|uniref:Uncharacterized protein n=1 Tax=Steinernema carpocapsae TaxID=34508 RepID=A0A4U5NZ65_STECR|nr:hypothetical protein L596_013090 [Steinernema carpocapsae]
MNLKTFIFLSALSVVVNSFWWTPKIPEKKDVTPCYVCNGILLCNEGPCWSKRHTSMIGTITGTRIRRLRKNGFVASPRSQAPHRVDFVHRSSRENDGIP